MRTERWLTVAGFGTWLVSALPTLLTISQGRMRPGAVAVWTGAFLAFGAAFGSVELGWPGTWQRRSVRAVCIATQACAGLVMIGVGGNIFAAAALVIVAGQLDEFSPRVASLWVAAQTAALLAVLLSLTGPMSAVTGAGALAGFQIFALAAASLTVRERRAREALSRANTELHATRALLVESSRIAERLRISRDLHDTLGHHLTALSLQLDVASRLAQGKAAEHVQQAHAITRLLLSDVRDVVSQLRSSSRLDLAAAIRALAAESGALAIHLELPDVLEIEEGAQADALLKCVQEIITNTTRHAAARNLWIHLEPSAAGIALHARDDGRGAGALTLGNGLTGMRERFEEYAGRVEFRAADGRGFEVHGFMPKPRLAS
jgi:signal transduction histidine kinase